MDKNENLKKGKRFSSTYQPETQGRKKSKLKGLIEANDLSSDDISDLITSMFDKTQDELNVIKNDPEQPFLIRAFVKAMIKDLEGDSLYNINTLMDRAIGKSKETKEVKFDDVSDKKLSREEMISKLKQSDIELDPIGS
jgi:vacuolar-type H+-ATPase subunit E/Vma4